MNVKPYEISLWKDELSLETQTYEELKIAILGSNDMTALSRAQNPSFTCNKDGSYSLKFILYNRYWDNDEQEFVDNPYINLLVNESKIKLKYDNKWYDFIVKTIEEDSDKNSFTYECQALFINELAKTGFKITFSQELENSTGTIEELAAAALEDTDWQVAPDTELIQQKQEEPLYRLWLKKDLSAKYNNIQSDGTIEIQNIDISQGDYIFSFYSTIQNQLPYFQFLYREDGNYLTDDDGVINNANCYYIENYNFNNFENDFVGDFRDKTGYESLDISKEYRGDKLVRSPKVWWDPRLEQYVSLFTDTTKTGSLDECTVCGYSEKEYLTTDVAQCVVVNPNNFTNFAGWETDSEVNKVQGDFYPPITLGVENNSISYLKIDYLSSDIFINTGFTDNRKRFIKNGLPKKELWVLRHRIYPGSDTNPSLDSRISPTVYVKEFTYNRGKIIPKGEIIAEFKTSVQQEKEAIALEANNYYQSKTAALYHQCAELITDYLDGTPINLSVLLHQQKIDEIDNIYDKNNITEYITQLNYYVAKFNLPGSLPTEGDEQNYEYYIGEFNFGLTYTDLLNKKYGIFIEFDTDGWYWIEDFEVFPFYVDEAGKLITPTTTFINGYYREIFSYYNRDENKEAKTKDDIQYTKSSSPIPEYVLQYDDSYAKRRSYEVSESNHFNIIQELCELFECWAEFEIEHDQNGFITGNKYVRFKNYIGIENYSGIKYGVNLKSVTRTIESNDIVTKLIVQKSENDFVDSGWCVIDDATDNPTGESFLYDFRYYYTHGLLNYAQVYEDFYSTTNNYLGYYTKLKKLNNEINELSINQGLLANKIDSLYSYTETYKYLLESCSEDIIDNKVKLSQFKEPFVYQHYITTPEDWVNIEPFVDPTALDPAYYNKNGIIEEEVTYQESMDRLRDNDKVLGYLIAIKKAEYYLDTYESEYENYQTALDQATELYEQAADTIRLLTDEKEELNKAFYNKYYRFIQEGTWKDDTYVDPNLYYYDALASLNVSAQPKITYKISLIDLSGLQDYENYKFNVGDITTIEDTEFFGWTYINVNDNSIKTPYKEQIIISEITYKLDNPDDNEITVQNFKTNFQDLFQRITANTAKLESASGLYNKATSLVTDNGSIQPTSLADSFAQNAINISNARNQSWTLDESGFTLTSQTDPYAMVRMTNGGIYLMNDGENWNLGITGNGINANYIRTGALDADRIRILNESHPTFLWDSDGITAYSFINNSTNIERYVRFNQYGVYGRKQNSEEALAELNRIKTENDFGLTWAGFFLKTSHQGESGSVEISSEEDIVVKQNSINRVKIGYLGQQDSNEVYGIELRNGNSEKTLYTSSNGDLWLSQGITIGDVNSTSSTVQIGFLQNDGSGYGTPVITAGSGEKQFIVYDSGHVIARDLDILNGDIVIFGADEEKVFYVTDEGILYMKGEVHATSGEFTGSIVANNGFIGDLEINEDGIVIGQDENNSITITADGIICTNNNFSIGTDGSIIANTIELGTGAEISDYIKLGNAYICNPDGVRSNGYHEFIQVINGEDTIIKIKDNGEAKFGNIIVDGNTSIISSSSINPAWELTPDVSTFNRIKISGVIGDIIYENASTQLAGTTFIFKDGTNFEDIDLTDKTQVTLSKIDGQDFIIGHIYYLTSSGYQKGVYAECISLNTFALLDSRNIVVNIAIDLGEKTSSVLDNWLIGINGCNFDINGLNKNSITMSSIEYDGNTYNAIPRIILGKIPANTCGNSQDTYGLFAESVYLTGTLTTRTLNTYSGVNTVGNAAIFNKSRSDTILIEENVQIGDGTTTDFYFTHNEVIFEYVELNGIRVDSSLFTVINSGRGISFNSAPELGDQILLYGQDISPIVFWAGSKDSTTSAIQQSPFQITTNGTLYAQRGYFNGTILSKALVGAIKLDFDHFEFKEIDTDRLTISNKTDDGQILNEIVAFTPTQLQVIQGVNISSGLTFGEVNHPIVEYKAPKDSNIYGIDIYIYE